MERAGLEQSALSIIQGARHHGPATHEPSLSEVLQQRFKGLGVLAVVGGHLSDGEPDWSHVHAPKGNMRIKRYQ